MNTERAGEFELGISKLGLMNRLTEIGIDGVRDRLREIDGCDARVTPEVVKSGYASRATVGTAFDDGRRAGVRHRLPGAPHGYALALFTPSCANNAAAMMLSRDVRDLDEVPAEMAQSALAELCTMMISGFVDAWADTFGEEIDVQTPTPVHSTERRIVERTAVGDDGLGLYVTSRLRLAGAGVVGQVYLFPENETFVEILDRLDARRIAGGARERDRGRG